MNEETRKNINVAFKRELGISYDEFVLLDCSKKHALIEQNRKKKRRSNEYDEVVIGNGKHTAFVRHECGERRMLSDGTLVIANKPTYNKPVAFVKKLTRRIKNR